MDPRIPIVDAYTNQDYTACISLIESSSSDISSQTDIRILQASCLININGRSSEAHQILDKILESEPENGLAFYGKGLAFLKESNLEKSYEYFTRASELDKTGVISKAQIMKLKTEELLKTKRTSNRLSGKQNKEKAAPSTCEICHRTFAQAFSLNRHKLIHSGERPHKCALCNFGFVQKSDLQRHMSVHNDNADFPCQSCAKKFKSKKNLSLHLMTHSIERPFKCETCGKDFKYRRLMKLHQIVHSKRRKYNCDFCQKIFVTKPSLKAHVMMHINRMNKEGVKLNGGGRIVENFEVKSGEIRMEMMDVEVAGQDLSDKMDMNSDLSEKLDITSKLSEKLDLTSKLSEKLDLTSKLPEKLDLTSKLSEKLDITPKSLELLNIGSKTLESSNITSNISKTEVITSKSDSNPAKTRKYTKRKQQNLNKSNQNPVNSENSNQNTKKTRGRPKKSINPQNTPEIQPNQPQNQNIPNNQEQRQDPAQIQSNSPSTSVQILSTSLQNSPQAVRNSARIQNRNSLGSKRSLIKTNPNSLRIRRESTGFDKNTANIQQKLKKVKHNLSIAGNPTDPDQLFNTSPSNFSDLFPQISITSNNPQKSSRFSINNIELPPSLKITPILGVEGSKIRSTRNSISTIGSDTSVPLNLIPPTKFINQVTSSPHASVIPALADPRISAIFSNPNISVAITSTSSSTTIAKTEMVLSTDSKWSIPLNSEMQISKDQQISIEDIKLEPIEVPNNEQNAETSSNHDSLFSSENEHPSEWNLFFKSLMHDLTKMDERQRRKFKQNTFMLIDDILQ